jgi:hypothetical protein
MKDFFGANEIPIGAQAMRRNFDVRGYIIQEIIIKAKAKNIS